MGSPVHALSWEHALRATVMRRLWLTWAWTRLRGQHRLHWWEVRLEVRDGPVRERVEDAIAAMVGGGR